MVFRQRVKNLPLYDSKSGIFSNKKYDSYACWTCTELCEAFTFLMENIYVQFDGVFYGLAFSIKIWKLKKKHFKLHNHASKSLRMLDENQIFFQS